MLTDEQREEIQTIRELVDDAERYKTALYYKYARKLIDHINSLEFSEQAWKEKYKKTKEMLDARLVFVNNGMNEEQWAIQERGIQAEERLNQVIEVLSYISDRVVFPLIDGDKYAFETAIRDIQKRTDAFLSSLSQGKEETT